MATLPDVALAVATGVLAKVGVAATPSAKLVWFMWSSTATE